MTEQLAEPPAETLKAAFTPPKVQTDTLKDLKLQPWTPERRMHAQTIGMIYPNLGKSGRAQLGRTNVYAGVAMDVSIFILLSTVEADSVEDVTRHDARQFGIQRKFHLTDSDEFWDAYAEFVKVNKHIAVSATRPKDAPTDEEEQLGED